MVSMNYRNLKVKCLEDRHKLTILIYMFEHQDEKIKKTDIYSNISTNSLIPRKLTELEEMGLITQTNMKFENNITYLKLTENGRKIAKMLYEIENLMNGNEQEESEEDYVRDHRRIIPNSLSEQQKD